MQSQMFKRLRGQGGSKDGARRALVEGLEGRTLFAGGAFSSDVGVWRGSDGKAYLDTNNDPSAEIIRATATQGAGSQVIAADFDGNTVSDIAIFSAGVWYIDLNKDGVADQTVVFGGVNGRAVAGDINADGIADLGKYNRDTGLWKFDTDRNGVADVSVVFGGTLNDIPRVADFDRDGRVDLVIYNTGNWAVDLGADGTANQFFNFGAGFDLPVLGDYDGNGNPDLMTFNNGQWQVDTNRDGTSDAGFVFGIPGDRPMVGYFDESASVFVSTTGSDANPGTTGAPVRTLNRALGLVGAADVGIGRSGTQGGFVRFAAGTYNDRVTMLNSANYTFVGAGMYGTKIAPSTGDAFLLNTTSNMWFYNMQFKSAAGRGVVGLGSSLWMRGVSTLDSRDNGVVMVNLPGLPSSINATSSRFEGSQTGKGMWLQDGTTGFFRRVSFDGNGTDLTAFGTAPALGADGGRGMVVVGNSTANINKSTFNSNLGGGMLVGGSASVVIGRSQFSFNQRENGLFFTGATTATISDSRFEGNGVTRGAVLGLNGIEIFGDHTGAPLTITGSTFRLNTGNGIFLAGGHGHVLRGNTFFNNLLNVYLFGHGGTVSATIVDNTFTVPVPNPFNDAPEGVIVDGPGATASIGSTTVVSDKNRFNNFLTQRSIHSGAGGVLTGDPLNGNTFFNSPNPIQIS